MIASEVKATIVTRDERSRVPLAQMARKSRLNSAQSTIETFDLNCSH
jgi:hypothetical protein